MAIEADGRLYGEKALTVICIAFLTVVLPWVCAGAINIAYNTSTVTTKAFPNAPNNYTHGVTWHSWTDGASHPTVTVADCVPYDHLTSTTGQYPSAPYQLNYANYGLQTDSGYENLTWRNIGSPFEAQVGQPSCTTLNDTIGIRLDPASALASAGLGQTMLRFNASIALADSWWIHGYLNHTYSEFDWWVEIDGVEMFSEQVRFGNPDAEIYGLGLWNLSGASPTNAHHIPTLRFDHPLNPVEERRMRDTLSDANLSTMNLSFFMTCLDTPDIYEPCAINENVGSSVNYEWYFHAESEWIAADDYDLIIQGTAFGLSLICLVIALGSTPLWNPVASRLRGGA